MADITSEKLSVRNNGNGFVHIVHEQIWASGVDMGGNFWVEESSVPWLIQSLESLLQDPRATQLEQQLGRATLLTYTTGHEMSPFLNVTNERTDTLEHPGLFGLMMTESIGPNLVQQLKSL